MKQGAWEQDLYRNAFTWFEMGSASALAGVLFLIMMTCTILVLALSSRRVYYEGQFMGR